MKTYTAEDFKKWGAQGGAKSKRVLTAAQAKTMVAAREKKRRKTKRVTRRANTQNGACFGETRSSEAAAGVPSAPD